MDQHIPRAISSGLRLRGIDVLTAFEDGTSALADPALLDRATALGRVLFTRDDDLLGEATRRQMLGVSFGGVIYAHQLQVSIGQCIHDLELLMLAGLPQELNDRVVFLPL
jgi:hypothetical protein